MQRAHGLARREQVLDGQLVPRDHLRLRVHAQPAARPGDDRGAHLHGVERRRLDRAQPHGLEVGAVHAPRAVRVVLAHRAGQRFGVDFGQPRELVERVRAQHLAAVRARREALCRPAGADGRGVGVEARGLVEDGAGHAAVPLEEPGHDRVGGHLAAEAPPLAADEDDPRRHRHLEVAREAGREQQQAAVVAAERRAHLLAQRDAVAHRLRPGDGPHAVALLVRVGPVLLDELLVVAEAAGGDDDRPAAHLLVARGHARDGAVLLDQAVGAGDEGEVDAAPDALRVERAHHRQPLALGRMAARHGVDAGDVDALGLVDHAHAPQPLEGGGGVVAVGARHRRLHVPLVERHVVAEHGVGRVVEDAGLALHARARGVEVPAGEARGAAHLVVRLQHDDARARVGGRHRRRQPGRSRSDDDDVVVALHAALPAGRSPPVGASWAARAGASSAGARMAACPIIAAGASILCRTGRTR